MMFKEQELNSYRSITAPQELHDRIVSAPKKRVSRPLHSAALVAACLALSMGVGYFFQPAEPEIIINGQLLESSLVYYDLSPATELRSAEMLTVPVELELSERCRISVTQGHLTILGEKPTDDLTAAGTVTLLWDVPRGKTMPELHIDNGRKVTKLTLEYEETQITITKKGE